MIDRDNADRLLTTTRSVRKRLDFSRPVPDELVLECLEVALQAPTASDMQNWSFLVVSDPDVRMAIADVYRKGFEFYRQMPDPGYEPDDPRAISRPHVVDSANYLADHMHEASHILVPCIEGRYEEMGLAIQASMYGSLLPAVWSFMLAARARGLGTSWTTLHLIHEAEGREVLGIPENVTHAGLFPIAYYTGDDFKPARRLPLDQVTYWNQWGERR